MAFTNDFPSHNGLEGDYSHSRVNHKAGCYVDGSVYTNMVEGYFAQLKQGIYGIYHHVRVKQLHRYCIENDYRYNSRRSKEVARFDSRLSFCDDRLMYKTLTGKESETTPQ
ncbi:MAG TPA: transposase [Blastocatellia bacterium]|nr:transposase [Blastocatellia bacterium]